MKTVCDRVVNAATLFVEVRSSTLRVGPGGSLHDDHVHLGIHIDRLAVNPDCLERSILARFDPPLISISPGAAHFPESAGFQECSDRSGRLMNPGLWDHPLGAQFSSTHHHQTDSGIVANRGVEACESTNIWLRFRFVKKRVALRSYLLP